MALNLLALAAGMGTRLRPLTLRLPKPLVPIADSNGLELQLQSLGDLTIAHSFANAHYLADELVLWAQKTQKFDQIFVEPELLGTGGPLRAVYDQYPMDELLVVNGDVYHNMDLQDFVLQARASGAEIALLSHPNPRFNTLRVRDGHLVGLQGRFGEEEAECTTFTGISWYSPKALGRLIQGASDIRQLWQDEIAAGRAPKVIEQKQSHFWIDMGSPEGYLEAVLQRLTQMGKRLYSDAPVNPIVGVETASIHGQVEFEGTAFLSNVVIFGGVKGQALRIPDGAVLKNCVLAADFCWENLKI